MSLLAAWPRGGYPDAPVPPVEPWVTHPAIDGSTNHMLVVGDTLHIAHGNWTGGAHFTASVNLLTGEPVTGEMVPSEGFEVTRSSNGTLYLPWADPTGSWSAPQGYSYSTDGGASWQRQDVAPIIHALDMSIQDGSLFVAGSGPDSGGTVRAAVWASHDDGATWSPSLELYGDSMARVRGLVQAGGALYAAATNVAGATVHRYVGTGWEPVAGVPATPMIKAGQNITAGGLSYGKGAAFDGVAVIPYVNPGVHHAVPPVFADASYVYGLDWSTPSIVRAPILPAATVEWSVWLPLPDLGLAQAAAMHDGFVYVATDGGRIFRLPVPAA